MMTRMTINEIPTTSFYSTKRPFSEIENDSTSTHIFAAKKRFLSDTSNLKIPSNLSGLSNLGNSCYLNAIIQALYAVETFRNYVIKNQKTPLMLALGRLFEDMSDTENSTVSPINFSHAFTCFDPNFGDYEQQDAQEFLQTLIMGLQDEVNICKYNVINQINPDSSPKCSSDAWIQYLNYEDSPLAEMMAGQLVSSVNCTVCGNSSSCYDPFWDLSLPLPANEFETNVEKCFKEFTALEEIAIEDSARCEKCEKPTKSTKKLEIERAPSILIMHLKRFTNEGFKLTTPKVIANDRLTTSDKTYVLTGLVSHHGNTLRSGHYTCHAMHNSKWYKFDDERVTELSKNDVSEVEDAYILFYVEEKNLTKP